MFLILELLYKKSDENHPISSVEIRQYLEEKGIHMDRKTFREDINFFCNMGCDIVTIKSSPNQFFWGERLFEIPELKLLIDAVASSRFITEKRSRVLIKKLTSLASENQRQELERHIAATGRAKTDNKRIYYIVDTITDAINSGAKIQFQYLEYNSRKEKILRNDGEIYKISPYTLYWNEDFYYVVGYSDKREKITAFRVDRLHNTLVLDEKQEPKPDGFDVADYAKKIFQMYDGEETVVTLECENALMKYIIDRFGMEVDTEERTETTFAAKVSVTLSPTFYGWVFQFEGKIKIIEPKRAVAEYSDMLRQQLE